MTDELRRLIAELDGVVIELRDCLAAEQSALSGRDAEGLARINAAKVAALNRLEQLEQQRRAWCQRQGLDPQPSAMTALSERLEPGGGTLREAWQRLTANLIHCRRLNRSNGIAVTAMQRRIQQALQLLRGGDAPAGLYGRSGIAIAAGPGRGIARA